MQQLSSSVAPRFLAADSFKPTFKIFIACEDQASLFQTRDVQSQVDVLCGSDVAVSRALWSFSLLRHDPLRECAAKEAAEAEMIVISLRARSELPSYVKSWLENLRPRSGAGQGALVILLSADRRIRTELQSQIVQLRRVAERLGLDFFCNRELRELHDLGARAIRRPENRIRETQRVPSFSESWSCGGINE